MLLKRCVAALTVNHGQPHGTGKVRGIHPLWTINDCTKFHDEILQYEVKSKVVDHPWSHEAGVLQNVTLNNPHCQPFP